MFDPFEPILAIVLALTAVVLLYIGAELCNVESLGAYEPVKAFQWLALYYYCNGCLRRRQ